MKKRTKNMALLLMMLFMIGMVSLNNNSMDYVEADTGVYISRAGQVVDSITYRGVTVSAIYRPYDGTNGGDTTYSCAAFV